MKELLLIALCSPLTQDCEYTVRHVTHCEEHAAAHARYETVEATCLPELRAQHTHVWWTGAAFVQSEMSRYDCLRRADVYGACVEGDVIVERK